MEIKIQCPCGTRYKFDADPALGQLPGPVACPVCGKDGTEAGNTFLRSAAAPTVQTPAIPAPLVPSIGPAPTPAAAPAGSKMVVNPSRLQVRSSHPPPSSESPALTVAAAPPPSAPAIPLPATLIPQKRKTALPSSDPSLPLAIVGSVAGAFVGALVWYGLIKFTGYASGWVAWGVGVAAGLGARLGRDRSPGFGAIAAVCAIVAIVGGEYLAISHRLDEEIQKELKGQYDQRWRFPKKPPRPGRTPIFALFSPRLTLTKAGRPIHPRSRPKILPISRRIRCPN